MKDLKQYIEEKLVVNKKYDSYEYHPKTWNELRQIIEDRYEEQGPGTKVEPIDFNDIDVSGMTTFYNIDNHMGIFQHTDFEYIDVSNWDVSNVKNAQNMFVSCEYLISVGDLSNWNISNVKNMGWMFNGCYKLKSIDISNWDVSNVQYMKYMFYQCFKLESIGDISGWDISNVKDMTGMFNTCEKLKSVGNLSKWDVSNVKDMRWMFEDSGITNKPSWYKG